MFTPGCQALRPARVDGVGVEAHIASLVSWAVDHQLQLEPEICVAAQVGSSAQVGRTMVPAPTVGAPAPRWWCERLRSASMPGSRPRGCGLIGLLVALALFASAPAVVARAGIGIGV